jgi:Calcineurin-like phosphoesterase
MDFDLISDLHIDQWPKDKLLNFRGLGTSLNCVVAGDVSQDLKTTRDFIFRLADAYQTVIFVDGNHEHKPSYDNIYANCEWFEREFDKSKNITYLWDTSCVIDKTAFIGSNGWWTFDYLEPVIPRIESIDAFCYNEDCSNATAIGIWDAAIENSEFLSNVVTDFNRLPQIEHIVMVTHTPPRKDLFDINIDLSSVDLAKLHNSSIQDVLLHDSKKKITTWCFGHYHDAAVDKTIDGIRYVSHPRGNPNDSLFPVYYPKLITL